METNTVIDTEKWRFEQSTGASNRSNLFRPFDESKVAILEHYFAKKDDQQELDLMKAYGILVMAVFACYRLMLKNYITIRQY